MDGIKNINAIILKKKDFLENDLILVLFENNGEISEVILKGAGKKSSKRRRHAEAMNFISGTVYKGRSSKYLQDINCVCSYSNLKNNLDLIIQALTLLEIIEKSLMHEDPHPEIFELLKSSLEEMNKETPNSYVAELSLVKIAHELGFLPDFKKCSHCQENKVGSNLYWDPINVSLHCELCGEQNQILEAKYRKAMEFFKQEPLHKIMNLKLSEDEKFHLRSLINQLFENHIERPLKALQSLQ